MAWLPVVLCVLIGLSTTVSVNASPRRVGRLSVPTIDAHPGQVVPIADWHIQSLARAQDGGHRISSNHFTAKDWYPVGGHATVFAGLVANGLYPHPYHGINLRTVVVPDGVAHGRFVIPWWYRTQFKLTHASAMLHTFVRLNGVIAAADLWVNGHEVANHKQLAGAYPVHFLDVTHWVHKGVNTVAMLVRPANPQRSLVMGWIDWNPAPPDNDMGPWRGVDVISTGPLTLRYPDVISKLQLPSLSKATLKVRVRVTNATDRTERGFISGTVAGLPVHGNVHLAPHQATVVTLSGQSGKALVLSRPRVWWPIGMGRQPLYHLQLALHVNGMLSDTASTTFGIRAVTSHLTKDGYRQFVINGHPILVRGAGWAPDMLLRNRHARMKAEFAYIRNLGLNAVRTEGKLEDPYFYHLADQYGIMVLAGWECCDKWEAAAGTGAQPWNAFNRKVAAQSMTSEARLLRNHPSVIAFLIGSDNAPPPKVANMYVSILRHANWPDPIVSAASDQATAAAGPSGLKMVGPYAWVPPSYWYADKVGGAFGFDSEVSAGADIPRLPDLKRMLTPAALRALWKDPSVRQFHATALWSSFSSLKPFYDAMAHTYGKPQSLAQYVAEAQLANYANTRAQFEAFNAHMDARNRATGVVYWMLNNAWPSLHWHLFDYYLDPAGAYFGAKKANQPIHIQYAYGTRNVLVVDHKLTAVHGLAASIKVRDISGKVRYAQTIAHVGVHGNHVTKVMTIPKFKNLSKTHFVELELRDAKGGLVSRNVYWLPAHLTQLDWPHSTWYTTPVTHYADMTELQSLKPAVVHAVASTHRHGGNDTTIVKLTVPANAHGVAFFVHLTINNSLHGHALTPVLWTCNDITLWPGETITALARYATSSVRGVPRISVSGWNVRTHDIANPIVRKPAQP